MGGKMAASSLPLSAQELCESIRASLPYDPARLDRVLGVDANRALVEVQSSASWKSLAARLRPGDTRARDARTAHATVGESLACNAAGPDGRPTVSHVESFTMVTPDGQLRRIDRVNNPSLFSLVVGGQGLFGTLYSVTLRIESLARAVAEASAPENLTGNVSSEARKLVLLVPPAGLEALIAGCRQRCAEWRVGLASLAVRRIREDRETFLRWAGREYEEVSVGLGTAATLGAEVRYTQLRRSLIDLAIAHGGGFPIACTAEATRAQTEACYPQLAAFLAEQRRVDPQERWVNDWLRRQRSLLTRGSCEVRWGRYAEV
jgi:FAD/FMN-containing dehydrogenase